MRNEYKVFLGINADGEAVYAQVTFGRLERDEDEHISRILTKGYFAVSFTSARMEVINDEFLLERMVERIEDWGYKEVGRILQDNPNITFNELPEYILRLDGREAVVEVDNFLPEFTLENGDEVVFTFSGRGQHDTRPYFLSEDNEVLEEAELLVPLSFYLKLNGLWDKYHLKYYPKDDFHAADKMSWDDYEILKAFEEEFHTLAEAADAKMESFLKEYIEGELEQVIKY